MCIIARVSVNRNELKRSPRLDQPKRIIAATTVIGEKILKG